MAIGRACFYPLAALVALHSVAAGSPSASESVPVWAAKFLKAWYASFNVGDAHGVAALFTPNARLGNDIGRSTIEVNLAKDFRSTHYHCTGQYDGVHELGDLAVAWGHESCTETSKVSGETKQTGERWLLVFELQANGEWLLAREAFEPADQSLARRPLTTRSSGP